MLGFLGWASYRGSAASRSVPGPERRRNRGLPGVERATEATAVRGTITALASPDLRSRRAFPAGTGSIVGVGSQRATNRPRKFDAVTDRRRDQTARTRRAKRLSTQAAKDAGRRMNPLDTRLFRKRLKPTSGRIARPPYPLRLVAGDFTGQHARIERREKGRNCRRQLCRGAGVDPLLCPMNSPDHAQ